METLYEKKNNNNKQREKKDKWFLHDVDIIELIYASSLTSYNCIEKIHFISISFHFFKLLFNCAPKIICVQLHSCISLCVGEGGYFIGYWWGEPIIATGASIATVEGDHWHTGRSERERISLFQGNIVWHQILNFDQGWIQGDSWLIAHLIIPYPSLFSNHLLLNTTTQLSHCNASCQHVSLHLSYYTKTHVP